MTSEATLNPKELFMLEYLQLCKKHGLKLGGYEEVWIDEIITGESEINFVHKAFNQLYPEDSREMNAGEMLKALFPNKTSTLLSSE